MSFQWLAGLKQPPLLPTEGDVEPEHSTVWWCAAEWNLKSETVCVKGIVGWACLCVYVCVLLTAPLLNQIYPLKSSDL